MWAGLPGRLHLTEGADLPLSPAVTFAAITSWQMTRSRGQEVRIVYPPMGSGAWRGREGGSVLLRMWEGLGKDQTPAEEGGKQGMLRGGERHSQASRSTGKPDPPTGFRAPHRPLRDCSWPVGLRLTGDSGSRVDIHLWRLTLWRRDRARTGVHTDSRNPWRKAALETARAHQPRPF